MVSPPGGKLERRIGLTKAGFKLASLHPNVGKPPVKQSERQSTADSEGGIYAPPESDEESLEQEELPLTKPESSNASIRSLQACGRDVRASSLRSSSPPGELPTPASIIRPTVWSKQKRNSNMASGDTSDDDGFFSEKKVKRTKTTYKSQSNTLATSSKIEKMNKGKTKASSSSPAVKKSGPVFRIVDTQPLISQGKLSCFQQETLC